MSYEPLDLVNHAIAFFGMAASGVCLLACILYRRVSGAMTLLILAFAGEAAVAFMYLVLGLASSLAPDLMPENANMLYTLAGFLSFATSALTAVSLFMVFGDIARRQDRSRARGADDDFDRRPRGFDDRDEPRWDRGPGGPDIRR